MAGAVYWVGADGNIYLKGANGVQNVGAANGTGIGKGANYGLNDGGFESNTLQQTVNAQRIADPNATAPRAPAGGEAAPVLNTGAVQNTQLALDQLPALLQSALAGEDQTHANTMAQFDAQEGQQRQTYDGSTTTNQQNYDANFMDSIRAGVKGLGGLMQILRGSGAGGGSVEGDVRDVVGGVTSQDIRGGADTQKQNQTALDSSLATFLTDLKGKRQVNEDTYVNNRSAIQRDNATQMQDLYSKLAGFYGDAKMTPQAQDYMAKAGSLTPTIAANSRSQVSAYDATPIAVQAPQLTAFAAPSQPDVAAAPQDGQVGSGIFTISKRKDQQTTPQLVAQGA